METDMPAAALAPRPAAAAGTMEQAMTPPLTDIEAVLREHGPMLSRIAGSYESEPARRDDLLQEISVAVWRALPSWRGDASLRTFAARVAHNRAIDHLGREKRARGDELHDVHEDPDANPLQHALAHQRRKDLLAAVRDLPLGQRQVVVLALEGFSQREIGEALNLEENTVTQRLSRARRQLQSVLAGET
jgi:RNA polymerase sigma-70 factor (ECF subfamily)